MNSGVFDFGGGIFLDPLVRESKPKKRTQPLQFLQCGQISILPGDEPDVVGFS